MRAGPFREPPKVELGALSVGLGHAARRAMRGIPSGGRLVSQRPSPKRPHALGALGCTGLVLAATVAFVAITTGWLPKTNAGVALVMATVIVAGACLAAVMLALDRALPTTTREGQAVGHAARLVSRRLARLARCADEDAARFGTRRMNALRRAISAASDPAIVTWIPDDVRGRAELLLARAIVARATPAWTRDEAVRAEVRGLLLRAIEHLDVPSPAEADLAALEASPGPSRVASRGAWTAEAYDAESEAEALAEAAEPRSSQRQERRLDVIA